MPDLRTEILRIPRFALVGGLATAAHLTTASSLVAIHLDPFAATAIGYLVAVAISFFGHRSFTFGSNQPIPVAGGKFVVVSLAALIANIALLNFLLFSDLLSDLLAVSVAAVIVPVISFLGSRLWVFKS